MGGDDERAQRRAQWWADRVDGAPDNAARALVLWDAVRTSVHRLPDEQRDMAWRAVCAHLANALADVEQRRE